jgi:hypothetical protein
MGFFSTTGKLLVATAKLTGQLGVGTVKVTGRALNGTAKFVASHQDQISSATKTVVGVSGMLVKEAGSAVAIGAGAVARGLHKAGAQSDGMAGKVLGHAAGYAVDAVGIVGKVAGGIGSMTQEASPAIGGVTGGAVSGVVGTVSGAVDSVAITDGDFERLRQRLQSASFVVRERSKRKLASIALAQRERRKKDLLDLLVVGGVTLGEIVRDPSKVPADVERAFELAYPGLASHGETFSDVVRRLPSDDVVGLVNGVKGKLFEIELVDHMNAGNLPDGLHAELAGSATQPGYDIRILDADGHTVDVLQAKATESVAYVKDALERYPDIDVTTTTEVHAQLVALGAADHVTSGGVSEAVLQQKVEAAVAAGHHHLDAGDLVPSSIGLAVIALSSFMDKSLSLEQKGAEFGDRAAKAGVTGAAAKTVLIATNTWWLGLAVGVGSRWLASYGGNKRQRYEALQRAVEALEKRSMPPRMKSIELAPMLQITGKVAR